MFRKLFIITLLALFSIVIFSESGDMVLLKIREFSTNEEAPDFSSIGLSRNSVKGDYEYYLVQFNGLVQESYKRDIEKAGGVIFDYIPENGFLVRLSNKNIDIVKSKKFVKFMQIWQPAYRIAPNLVSDKQISDEKDIPGKINLLIQIFSGEDVAYFHNKLKAIEGLEILAGDRIVRVSIPAEKSNEIAVTIANMTEVYWVERDYPVVLHNAWSRWILDTFDTLNMKYSADSWNSQLSMSSGADSARMQLYAHGLYGLNQIVGDDDTGCDWDNIYFRDPLGTKPIYDKDKDRICETTGTNRKIVAYNVISDTFDLTSSGHGSHTSGSVLADSMNSGLPSITAFARVQGMAPMAKLAFTDIGGASDALILPTNYQDIYQWGYNAGARIHTSSWGQSAGGYSSYTLNSQQVDSCAWDKKDFLMFRSAGNDNTSRDSVNTPATAKNIVCVGATESGFGSATTTWATYGGATRNELLDVAEFSSHGPTKEGMMRPDVCATGGWYIWSVDSDGNLASNNAGILTMGGTSMATPTTAGFGALVRQYFTEGWYPSGTKSAGDAIAAPSASLMKAMIINSTRNSPGAYSISTINSTATQSAPSMGQGWGRITLADAIFFAGDTRDLKVWDVTSGFTSAGQYNEYTITTGPSTTEYIKVVLVWTDYPAGVAPTNIIVNDLNLTVTINGNTYLGNVFGTTARSITGGVADTKNVTEVVWLDAVPNQTMTIRVTGFNIPSGPQPYAIVATGDFITAAKINYKKSVILDTPTPVLVDAKLNNGETTDFNVWVSNNTGASQSSITAKLREGSTYITNLDSLGTYGTVANNDSAYSVYRFAVASNTPNGTAVPCTLFVSYGAKVDTNAFSLVVTGISIAEASRDSIVYDYNSKKTDAKLMIDDNYATKLATTATVYVRNNDPSSVKAINVTNVTVKNGATWIINKYPTTGAIAVGDSLGIKVIADTTGKGLTLPIYYDTLLIYTDADFEKAITLQVPLILYTSAFTASFESNLKTTVNENNCILNWTTNGKSKWYISRTTASNNTNKIAEIYTDGKTGNYSDKMLKAGIYYYKVGTPYGNDIIWSNSAVAHISNNSEGLFVENSTNGSATLIKFSLAGNSKVTINVCDMTGRIVKTLINGEYKSGSYKVLFDAKSEKIATGIYFIKGEFGGKIYNVKTIIID